MAKEQCREEKSVLGSGLYWLTQSQDFLEDSTSHLQAVNNNLEEFIKFIGNKPGMGDKLSKVQRAQDAVRSLISQQGKQEDISEGTLNQLVEEFLDQALENYCRCMERQQVKVEEIG